MFPQYQDGTFKSDFLLGFNSYLSLLTSRGENYISVIDRCLFHELMFRDSPFPTNRCWLPCHVLPGNHISKYLDTKLADCTFSSNGPVSTP